MVVSEKKTHVDSSLLGFGHLQLPQTSSSLKPSQNILKANPFPTFCQDLRANSSTASGHASIPTSHAHVIVPCGSWTIASRGRWPPVRVKRRNTAKRGCQRISSLADIPLCLSCSANPWSTVRSFRSLPTKTDVSNAEASQVSAGTVVSFSRACYQFFSTGVPKEIRRFLS